MHTDNSPSTHASQLFRDYEPERIFAVATTPAQTVTQREFLSAAYQLADQLPPQKYAINLCEDRYLFALTFVANILKGTINLLPQNRQQKSISSLLDKYPECSVLTDADGATYGAINVRHVSTYESNALIPSCPQINDDQTIAIAFTSGSTGEPKAENKYWKTLNRTAELLYQRFVGEEAVLLVGTVACQHMYGLECMLFMALQGRAAMHCARPFFPADIQAILNNAILPIVLISTPIHIRTLLKSELTVIPPKLIISATAPLDASLCTDIEQALKTEVAEIYGCTEAGSLATRHSAKHSHWTLLPSFQLKREDKRFVLTAPHVPRAVILEDSIEQIDHQHFKLLGRGADLVNIAGKRASLSEINNYLLQIEGVKDGVIFAHPTKSERLTAIVVSDQSEKAIQTELLKKFDPVMLPRPIQFTDAIPRTDSGKVTIANLQELWKNLSIRHV